MADNERDDRRRFLKAAAGLAAASAVPLGLARGAAAVPSQAQAAATGQTAPAPAAPVATRIRFGVIGLNHGHIYGQVVVGAERGRRARRLPREGGRPRRGVPEALPGREARAGRARDPRGQRGEARGERGHPERARASGRARHEARQGLHGRQAGDHDPRPARGGAPRPEGDRAHLLDLLLGALRQPRGHPRARAGEGRRDRAGPPRHGLGPHRENPKSRPAWFWDKKYYGGILCDIASHQADHFLSFTGSTRGEVAAARVANHRHPEQPDFEDFGDVTWSGDGGTGYVARRLVHARTASRRGATAGSTSSAPTATSRSGRTSTSPAARAASTSSSSTRRRRATSTARTRSSTTARGSSPTSSTAPRRRCRRRTASSPPRWS